MLGFGAQSAAVFFDVKDLRDSETGIQATARSRCIWGERDRPQFSCAEFSGTLANIPRGTIVALLFCPCAGPAASNEIFDAAVIELFAGIPIIEIAPGSSPAWCREIPYQDLG